MKKYCSTCGNQLELSQRFCAQCGVPNPFFVAAFTFLSDQSEKLERLRLEKERIDKELKEKEEEQAEFTRQENLKKRQVEEEKLKQDLVEKEQVIREYAEIEAKLKLEIDALKQEAEKNKAQTLELVNQVRTEVQQLEDDNKKIKQEFENLSKTTVASKPKEAKPEGKGRRVVGLSILIFIFCAVITGVVYMIYSNKVSPVLQEANVSEDTTSKTEPQEDLMAVNTVAYEDTTPLDTMFSVSEVTTDSSITDTVLEEPKPEKAAPARPKVFTPTAVGIRNDLTGKRIMGCGVTIERPDEIQSVTKITLVEKLQNGQLKYKCMMTILKNDYTYLSTPYLYYDINGKLVKIDGTNCE